MFLTNQIQCISGFQTDYQDKVRDENKHAARDGQGEIFIYGSWGAASTISRQQFPFYRERRKDKFNFGKGAHKSGGSGTTQNSEERTVRG